MSSFLNENHGGSLTLTLLNVLGVLNVLHVLHTCASYMCFMCLICPWTHRWPAGSCFPKCSYVQIRTEGYLSDCSEDSLLPDELPLSQKKKSNSDKDT